MALRYDIDVPHARATCEGSARMSIQDLQLYGSSAAAREVGVSLRQLYYWVGVLQVVRPQQRQHGTRVFRRFDATHLKTLKRMRTLLERGFTLRAAARMIRAKVHPGFGGRAGRRDGKNGR